MKSLSGIAYLMLGIVSLGCGLIGIPTFAMATARLKQMDAEGADPSERSLVAMARTLTVIGFFVQFAVAIWASQRR
ncbi:MAG: hypothetical protein ACK4XJ_01340 [Fimbriimonadaceae bacterium]